MEPRFSFFEEGLASFATFYATTFSRVPMGSMLIRIKSPLANVNESGGTMPVPVIRKAPAGKRLCRKRYSTSEDGERLSSESIVLPENAVCFFERSQDE